MQDLELISEVEQSGGDQVNSTASVAKNYFEPINTIVNNRTGGLQVMLSPQILKSAVGLDLDFSIVCNQTDAFSDVPLFGLPNGWTYKLSYIYENRIVINGGQSYVLDLSYESGMQYYELKDKKMIFFEAGQYPTLPYDTSQQYFYLLQFSDGSNQYFDDKGKLICIDDKWGNHQMFYYQDSGFITETQLTKVETTEGTYVNITYNQDEIVIGYPSGGQNNIQFSFKTDGKYLTDYIDPIGDTTHITYGAGTYGNFISEITYPSGLVVGYDYGLMSYKDNGIDMSYNVVSKVTKTYLGDTRTTTYNFNPIGSNHNYLGFPTYDIASGSDVLFESNSDSYYYYAQVNDGVRQIKYKYNHLHLVLSIEIATTIDDVLVGKVENQYFGENNEGDFPHYSDLPGNYQFPEKKIGTVFNEGGDAQQYQELFQYDDFGNNTQKSEYKQIKGDFKLIKETLSEFDQNYSVQTLEDIRDYMPEGVISDTPTIARTQSVLTGDNKAVKQSVIGSLLGQFEPDKQATFEYDGHGRIISQQLEWANNAGKQGITKTGQTFSFSQDNGLNTYSITTIDFENNKNTQDYDLSSGFLLTQIDPLGNKKTYTYDNLGRRLSETDQLGIKTIYEYFNSENKAAVTYQNGYKKCQYFDGFGNCIKKTDIPTLGGGERVLGLTEYNDLGQMTSQSGILGVNSITKYTYNKYGRTETQTDAQGNVTTYSYDLFELKKESQFNGVKSSDQTFNPQSQPIETILFGFDGDVDSMSNAKRYNSLKLNLDNTFGDIGGTGDWIKQTSSYDLYQNPVSQTSSGSDEVELINELTRDLLGNVLSSKRTLNGDVNNSKESSTKSYNELGWLINETTPNNMLRTMEYNAMGSPLKLEEFDKTVITHSYFANQNIQSLIYPGQDGNDNTINITYDENGKLVASVEQVDSNGDQQEIQYKYTLDGLISQIIYPDQKSITYEYNDNGYLIQMTDVLGNITTYTYNDYGQIISVSNMQENQNVELDYYGPEDKGASGKVKSMVYSDVTVSYKYSAFNAISEILVENDNSDILLMVKYTYEQVLGNVVSAQYSSSVLSGNQANYTHNYSYNGLNQLVKEQKLDSHNELLIGVAYEYDASGNVVQRTVTKNQVTTTKYQYDSDNKLIQVIFNDDSKGAMEYDNNGNLKQDIEGNSYEYNNLNQLITSVIGGKTTVYTYYGNGLRATKKVGDQNTVTFYYDNQNNANIVNEVQGSETASYLMYGAARLVRLYNDGQNLTSELLIKSYKDVLMTVDDNGSIVNNYTYTGYGLSKESSVTFSLKENPFQYNSEYFDIESGFYYFRSRYYAPKWMCFITRDNIVIFNSYAYANGNPVMNVDPSGHLSVGAIIGISALAAVVIVASVAAAVLTLGASAAIEGAAAGGAAAGGAIGGALAGDAGVAAGAVAGGAVAAGGAEGAIGGAAVGAAAGAMVPGLGAGAGAGAGAMVGAVFGGVAGMAGAAAGEGVAVSIGTAVGGAVGAAGGAAMGAVVDSTLGTGALFTTAFAAGGTYVGGVAGAAAGAAVGLGAEAGGIVGTTVAMGTTVVETATFTAATVTEATTTVLEVSTVYLDTAYAGLTEVVADPMGSLWAAGEYMIGDIGFTV